MAMNIREFEVTLVDADARLTKLRRLYDQWFAGVERAEPQSERTQFDALMRRMRNELPRNTALRFRFQQLNHRYTTYSTYWSRIARQIEEGTYQRDVLKARRQREKREEREERFTRGPLQLDDNLDLDAALEDAQAAVDERERRLQAAAKARVRAAAAGGLSDEQIQHVYRRYIAARAQNSERIDNVKVESLAKTLRGMMPKLREKHGDRQIDFEVVVKNGRVALRPKAL